MGASLADRKSKKFIVLRCHLLLFFATTRNHFLTGLWHVTKLDCIQQRVMTSSVAGLRTSSKALPKIKFAWKKVVVTLWWSAAHLIHCSFLNSIETITSKKYAQQIDEMHWKLQCLQLGIVQQKDLILHDNAQPHITKPVLLKLSELGPHPPYSPDLLPIDHHFFKHLDNFLQGKCVHNQPDAENAFQEFV